MEEDQDEPIEYPFIPSRNQVKSVEFDAKLKRFKKNVSYFAKTIMKTALVLTLLGTAVFLYQNLTGHKPKEDHVAKCIEDKCRDTLNPLYSEPESNISLWNLDKKGRYGEINIEVVTSYKDPKKVLWYNPKYLDEIKERGLIIDAESKEFTQEEIYRANKVANYQVFQECLGESK